ncbi:hypothetical protein GHT09_013504 [Marmota monax]|uniref:G-protein coupled receptors family 3 profile domain-containing protein n=1 Tax=Marmota monax TaxID=9995 RepID=A0A834QEC8_MARMO|nr:hypothetical protein GHT09_013504 [Marmota monax]
MASKNQMPLARGKGARNEDPCSVRERLNVLPAHCSQQEKPPSRMPFIDKQRTSSLTAWRTLSTMDSLQKGSHAILHHFRLWWPDLADRCSKTQERKWVLNSMPTDHAEDEISNQTDMDQCVKCPAHQYANTEQTTCLQKAVTFLAYEDPLGMALACTALCFSALTAAVLGVFPPASCRSTFGLVFTVAVSTVLAKTVTVILAFKVTAPGRRMRRCLVSGAPNFIIPSCSLIQLTLCGVWLGTSPPFVDTDTHSDHGCIIITCNKGSVIAFYCALGYLGSLALGTFTVAFLARNLPDTFNEAKFLTFSMLVFCSVWLTFLPVYHSTKGKVMVAMEVFSILASSAGLLGCIFVPKCYVVLLRPHRSSLCGSREKIHCGSNKPS